MNALFNKPASERTPLERAIMFVEGAKMARANARRHRVDGDEDAARAAFGRAYAAIKFARGWRRWKQ